MAEQFTKPKAFTKDWFSYVWCYYKVWIISVVCVAVLAGFTIAEFVNRVKADGVIYYAATDVIATESRNRIEEKLSGLDLDITDDGITHITIDQMNFTPDALADPNMSSALDAKLMSALASDEAMLYIFDEMLLCDVYMIEPAEGVFETVTDWCEAPFDESLLYTHPKGTIAISLKDSAFFKELGIDSSKMYLAVRKNYKPEDEDRIREHQNCIAIANALVKN